MSTMNNSSSIYSKYKPFKIAKIQEAVNVRFSSTIDFSQKNMLFTGTTKTKVKRPGLIDHNSIFKTLYNSNDKIIISYSSGEESENDEDPEQNPGIKDVIENMWDHNTIQQVESLRNIPKSARAGLIFSNIDDCIKAFDLKTYIEEIPSSTRQRICIEIEEIRIFRKQNKNFGFVLFNNLVDCEMVYNFFNGNQRKKHYPCKNFKGEVIEVSWAYDKLDLKNSGWYGVILRNVPPKCTSENIQNQCSARGEKVSYALKPLQIRSQFCSIVILENLDDAEKLCISLNQKEIAKNKFLKVHLHPRCCKISNLHFLPQNNAVKIPEQLIIKKTQIPVKNEIQAEDKSFNLKKVQNEFKEKQKKMVKDDKSISISVISSNLVNNDTNSTLNSLLSNFASKNEIKSTLSENNNSAKPYDIESNPTRFQEKTEKKVNTRAVVSNIEKTLLNLLQKTTSIPPNNNLNNKIETNNSSNTIINANNINIINTTINNDICISNNVFINSFPKNDSSNLQIFNNSTIQLTNTIPTPIEKQPSVENISEKKKFENSNEIKEEPCWKNNNFYPEQSNNEEEVFKNNEGVYKNKRFKNRIDNLNKEVIIKDFNSKRKYSTSSSESSSFINRNNHLKKKRKKSSSISATSESRFSNKKPRKHIKKYKRSYSKSNRSISKSNEKILFNNVQKEETKEKEGEFYKKFLQRFNNKVPFDYKDKNLNKGKYINVHKKNMYSNKNNKNTYRNQSQIYPESKYKPYK